MCYFVTSQTSSSATTQKNTVEKIKGFPLKAKSFQNTATYQKLKGGGSINPPPVPPRENDFECTSLRVKSTGQRPVRKT